MTRFWRIEHRDSDNESGRNTGYEGERDATIVEKDKQKCFKCGKTEHIARECRSGGGGGSGGRGYGDRGFNGKCNSCGKQGHKRLTSENM